MERDAEQVKGMVTPGYTGEAFGGDQIPNLHSKAYQTSQTDIDTSAEVCNAVPGRFRFR